VCKISDQVSSQVLLHVLACLVHYQAGGIFLFISPHSMGFVIARQREIEGN